MEQQLRQAIQDACSKPDNYRVVVFPDFWLARDAAGHVNICREMEKAIARHIDRVTFTTFEFDRVCQFCGSQWEVAGKDQFDDLPEGQPLCCDAAIAEFDRVIQEARDAQQDDQH